MGLVTLISDLFTLKLMCESHLRLGTFLPNLGTLGLWVLELFAICTRRTDGRTTATLTAPFPTGGGIIIVVCTYKCNLHSLCVWLADGCWDWELRDRCGKSEVLDKVNKLRWQLDWYSYFVAGSVDWNVNWPGVCKRGRGEGAGFCRAMLSSAVMRCLSVTFVNSVETNKLIFNFFHHRVATPF